jgi:hypothetical protein
MMPRTTPALQDERFLLLETLGHGGMASVFRAFDRVEQRVVALKAPADTDRAGPSNPLSTEFEVWSRLQHPNVVQAYELGTARTGPLTPGAPYLVIEHVRGGPLNRVLRVGREAPAAIEDVAVQLLRGLGHVHDAGLVHRDLKPGNVLVRVGRRGSAQVKLTDFGLAVNRGLRGEAGTISGSLPFVAPEVLLGRPLDGRADLYGLGILLYHLATGEMPARSRKVDDLMRWHLAGPPADPRRARPRFPGRLARFIARLTARMPEQRPGDGAEALSLLGAGRRWASPRRTGALCRGLRARLRLAMDAARLGARRLFVLPRGRASSRELERQAGVWSQIHGLLFHRLDAPLVPVEARGRRSALGPDARNIHPVAGREDPGSRRESSGKFPAGLLRAPVARDSRRARRGGRSAGPPTDRADDFELRSPGARRDARRLPADGGRGLQLCHSTR